MYLGKRKIFNKEKHEASREQLLQRKDDATFIAFSELEELINTEQLAMQYFDKTKEWLDERIDGCVYLTDKAKFSSEEYHTLAEAFRHIAQRLQAHADEIDNAKEE